ncbi:MAG: hypothetical protein LBL42_04475, partial [Tannerella sp.]|nr:hypothetical protein [Tannerella sp.]
MKNELAHSHISVQSRIATVANATEGMPAALRLFITFHNIIIVGLLFAFICPVEKDKIKPIFRVAIKMQDVHFV